MSASKPGNRDVRDGIAALDAERSRLHDELREARRTISRLRNEYAQVEVQLRSRRNGEERSRQRREEAEQQIAALIAERDAERHRTRQLETELSGRRRDLARQEAARNALERRLCDARKRLEETAERELELERRVVASEIALERLGAAAASDRSEAEAIRDRLRADRARMRRREDRLQAKLREIRTRAEEIVELRQQVVKLESELTAAQAQLRTSQKRAIEFDAKIRWLREKRAKLESELSVAHGYTQIERDSLRQADAATDHTRQQSTDDPQESDAAHEAASRPVSFEQDRRQEAALRRAAEVQVVEAEAQLEQLRAELVDTERRRAQLEAEAQRVRDAEDQVRRMTAQLARTRELATARGDRLRAITSGRSYRILRISWRIRRAMTAPIVAASGLIGALLVAGAVVALARDNAVVAMICIAVLAAGVALTLTRSVLVAAARSLHRRALQSGARARAIVPAVARRMIRACRRIASRGRTAARPVPGSSDTPAETTRAGETADPTAERSIASVVGGPWAEDPIARRELADLTVAAILDEMSLECFGPECRLLTFTPDDWRMRLERGRPDVLLVESAWNGNHGSWQYRVASYPAARFAGLPDLRELLSFCHEQGIPTVFWNKEDPVHFDRFREAAALFDHVLTTDADCVERYEALDSEYIKSVGVLSFAVQPQLYHPVGASRVRQDAPVFAGTYYRDRHPERRRALEQLLDGARSHGLIIFDRTAGVTSEAFGFPSRFEPHVRGRIPYQDLPRVFRSHKVGLNANSVVASPTMFSRRVFEIVACGAAVVSTCATAIEPVFGDSVVQVDSEEESRAAIDRLLSDEDHRRSLVRRARRTILSRHTYRDRLGQIADVVGIPWHDTRDAFAALVPVEGQVAMDDVRAVFAALARQDCPPQEVFLGVEEEVNAPDVEAASAPLAGVAVRTIRRPGASDPRLLAACVASPWITVMRPGAAYGPQHLTALKVAARTADADITGGLALGAPVGEDRHRFGVAVHPDAALARRELVVARGWPETADEALHEFADWSREGIRLYVDEPGEAAPAEERNSAADLRT